MQIDLTVACTSGPIFEKKNMKQNPIFSVQKINYQIDKMHNLFNFILTASKMEFSFFLAIWYIVNVNRVLT